MRIAGSAADSNTGRRRRHNEDAYVFSPPMFAVADGMGGAQAGEVASALAAATLVEGQARPEPGSEGEGHVVELIRAANRRVHQRAIRDASASGMGTTLTAAVFQPDGTVAIGHVGDSRAYRLRDGALEQLTQDHSLVAELVRRGELTPEEAAVHPQRSVITRALGTDADVEVDSFTVETAAGDVFLLCSDGLTTMVDPSMIAEIVQRHRLELDVATRALIRAANDRGGEDNITAVLFAIGDGDPDPDGSAPTATLDPAEEDTLHPEDAVALPTLDPPPAEVTMVVPAGALGGAAPSATDPPPAGDPAEQASFTRLMLASLLIVALVALIVVLVVKALPR